jgi:hypothetical protein
MTGAALLEVAGELGPIGAEFGPREIADVPLALIGTPEQIRKEYLPEDLAELKDSMVIEQADSRTHFELINPVTIGAHDTESAERYIADLNLAWGTEYTLADFTPHIDDGGNATYFILISGFRRHAAITQLTKEHRLDKFLTTVSGSIKRNISFEDAFILQYSENIHVRPKPQEEAVAIRTYFDFMRAKHTDFTQEACAKRFRCGSDKISEALRFTDLPLSLQDLAGTTLTYGNTVLLHKMYAMYRSFYQSQFTEGPTDYRDRDGKLLETPEAVAEYETHTYLQVILKNLTDRHIKANGVRVEAEIRTHTELLRMSLSGQQLEFDLILADSIGDRRRYTSRRLFETVMSAVDLLARAGDLEPPQRTRLLAALGYGAIRPNLAEETEATPLFA